MRPPKGLTHVLELIFVCLMLVILLMGLSCILRHSRRRIDHARIAEKWERFRKKFLSCSAVNENGSVKGVVVAVKWDGVADGNDVEAGKAISEEEEDMGEAEDYMVSSVLIRLQLRFLFTIMEESKEDQGSDSGRLSRGELSKRLSITRSLSDLWSRSSRCLSESTPSMPPSKFKFLRDADDIFYRRLKLEAEERALGIHLSSQLFPPVKDGSWSKIIGRRKEHDILPQIIPSPSASSRVLPLESSPPY